MCRLGIWIVRGHASQRSLNLSISIQVGPTPEIQTIQDSIPTQCWLLGQSFLEAELLPCQIDYILWPSLYTYQWGPPPT